MEVSLSDFSSVPWILEKNSLGKGKPTIGLFSVNGCDVTPEGCEIAENPEKHVVNVMISLWNDA